MVEGILQSYNPQIEVYSAGTNPALRIHPFAVDVMKDINIDISSNKPNSVNDYLNVDFDYVITVCGGAKEACPVFTGNVINRVHIGFDDPAEATGSNQQKLNEFIRIRDEIKTDFYDFYINKLKP